MDVCGWLHLKDWEPPPTPKNDLSSRPSLHGFHWIRPVSHTNNHIFGFVQSHEFLSRALHSLPPWKITFPSPHGRAPQALVEPKEAQQPWAGGSKLEYGVCVMQGWVTTAQPAASSAQRRWASCCSSSKLGRQNFPQSSSPCLFSLAKHAYCLWPTFEIVPESTELCFWGIWYLLKIFIQPI